MTLSLSGLALIAFAFHAAAGEHFTISGTVINTATGAPVPYAQVALLPSGDVKQTDAGGAFQFSDLEPGDCSIVADKRGFVADEADEDGISVSLTESKTKLVMRLNPLSAIRGRVLDDSGDAVEGATVIAFKPRLRTVASGRT